MKLIEGFYITQTERRHIKQVIDSGEKHGHTKIKMYTILESKGNVYTIWIQTKERNDYGQPIMRKSKVKVMV